MHALCGGVVQRGHGGGGVHRMCCRYRLFCRGLYRCDDLHPLRLRDVCVQCGERYLCRVCRRVVRRRLRDGIVLAVRRGYGFGRCGGHVVRNVRGLSGRHVCCCTGRSFMHFMHGWVVQYSSLGGRVNRVHALRRWNSECYCGRRRGNYLRELPHRRIFERRTGILCAVHAGFVWTYCAERDMRFMPSGHRERGRGREEFFCLWDVQRRNVGTGRFGRVRKLPGWHVWSCAGGDEPCRLSAVCARHLRWRTRFYGVRVLPRRVQCERTWFERLRALQCGVVCERDRSCCMPGLPCGYTQLAGWGRKFGGVPSV